MSDFPKFVYRKAKIKREDGSAFDTLLVANDDDLSDSLMHGWHHDVISALTPQNQLTRANDDVSAVPADDVPPTRAELELKAVELGIKFDGRTTDRKLGVLISEVLGE